jgi:Protein of unknown function (DUF2911)
MFLFTSTPLDVSNSKIAIGAYSMYLIPQRDNGTLVLNKNVTPEVRTTNIRIFCGLQCKKAS